MSQTPQPEESPDEILARRIEFFRGSEKFYRDAAAGSVGELHAESVLAADKYKQDLAMLEAMRDSRFSLKVLADIADCYDTQEWPLRPTYVLHEAFNAKTGKWSKLTVADCTAARVLLRQSDDAIRGMRG